MRTIRSLTVVLHAAVPYGRFSQNRDRQGAEEAV